MKMTIIAGVVSVGCLPLNRHRLRSGQMKWRATARRVCPTSPMMRLHSFHSSRTTDLLAVAIMVHVSRDRTNCAMRSPKCSHSLVASKHSKNKCCSVLTASHLSRMQSMMRGFDCCRNQNLERTGKRRNARRIRGSSNTGGRIVRRCLLYFTYALICSSLTRVECTVIGCGSLRLWRPHHTQQRRPWDRWDQAHLHTAHATEAG